MKSFKQKVIKIPKIKKASNRSSVKVNQPRKTFECLKKKAKKIKNKQLKSKLIEP